jgi:hypothetical protein
MPVWHRHSHKYQHITQTKPASKSYADLWRNVSSSPDLYIANGSLAFLLGRFQMVSESAFAVATLMIKNMKTSHRSISCASAQDGCVVLLSRHKVDVKFIAFNENTSALHRLDLLSHVLG